MSKVFVSWLPDAMPCSINLLHHSVSLCRFLLAPGRALLNHVDSKAHLDDPHLCPFLPSVEDRTYHYLPQFLLWILNCVSWKYLLSVSSWKESSFILRYRKEQELCNAANMENMISHDSVALPLSHDCVTLTHAWSSCPLKLLYLLHLPSSMANFFQLFMRIQPT